MTILAATAQTTMHAKRAEIVEDLSEHIACKLETVNRAIANAASAGRKSVLIDPRVAGVEDIRAEVLQDSISSDLQTRGFTVEKRSHPYNEPRIGLYITWVSG